MRQIVYLPIPQQKQFLDLDEKDICGYMEECPEYNTEFWSMVNSGEIHENKKVLFGTERDVLLLFSLSNAAV